ncbi:Fibronectin type III, partial [Trinorchestia longiramus]
TGSVEATTTNLEKSVSGLPPASNVSVRVRALNERGASNPSPPVHCTTSDDLPGPPARTRAVPAGPSSVVVTWSPPTVRTGSILHYTLYTQSGGQGRQREVVAGGPGQPTWREVTALLPGVLI